MKSKAKLAGAAKGGEGESRRFELPASSLHPSLYEEQPGQRNRPRILRDRESHVRIKHSGPFARSQRWRCLRLGLETRWLSQAQSGPPPFCLPISRVRLVFCARRVRTMARFSSIIGVSSVRHSSTTTGVRSAPRATLSSRFLTARERAFAQQLPFSGRLPLPNGRSEGACGCASGSIQVSRRLATSTSGSLCIEPRGSALRETEARCSCQQ